MHFSITETKHSSWCFPFINFLVFPNNSWARKRLACQFCLCRSRSCRRELVTKVSALARGRSSSKNTSTYVLERRASKQGFSYKVSDTKACSYTFHKKVYTAIYTLQWRLCVKNSFIRWKNRVLIIITPTFIPVLRFIPLTRLWIFWEGVVIPSKIITTPNQTKIFIRQSLFFSNQ